MSFWNAFKENYKRKGDTCFAKRMSIKPYKKHIHTPCSKGILPSPSSGKYDSGSRISISNRVFCVGGFCVADIGRKGS